MIIIDDDGVMHKVVPIEVLDKIKAEIETDLSHFCFDDWGNENSTWKEVKAIIEKYREGNK